MPVVELRRVTVTYHTQSGEARAVQDLSLDVEEGEFVSLVGPSGCGKTTLLSLIAGLVRPDEGEVVVGGVPVRGPNRLVGYMMQHDHLLGWRTVLDNCLLGLEVQGRRTPANVERVRGLLAAYGLAEFVDRFPAHLSGGMRQRAALVRTLALDPQVLLLDEPFSALDYQTRLQLEQEVSQILREQRRTAILVTHDIAEAVSMADRVVVLTRRPARIKREYAIELSPRRSPVEVRELPGFSRYFRDIWRDLDVQI
ncbi:MAG: ABC transporter ATP-binding protein [Firmicutes bacterium]|nr:ABC transporter ATP-binding protein [Bacillota bacterium]